MAVIVFLSFWVLVAIGLVVMGIRSGRGPADKSSASRGGRAYWFVAFGVILIGFGVGIPVAASVGNEHSSKDIPESDLTNLTEAQENGRELFGKYCKSCHTLAAANAVAQVGPNLDTLRPNEALVLDALEKGRARGNGAMAANLVQGEDAQDVAEFVAAAVGRSEEDEEDG